MAYDKVYYPICCLLKSEKSRDTIITECETYLNDNAKHVDRSTLKAFRYLKDSEDKQKKAYDNFVNNVYSLEIKIRRRLGYLEPNIFVLYTYSSPIEKRVIRMTLEIMVGYIPLLIMSITNNEKMNRFCVTISMLFLGIFVIEFLVRIVINVFKLIGKGIIFLLTIVRSGLDKLSVIIYKKMIRRFKRERRKKKH